MIDKTANVLITGASGAFGRAIVARMAKQGGFRIFSASRQCLNTKVSLKCDVRDKDQIAAAIDFSKPDIILHLVATLSNDLTEAYAVNVEPTRHILDLVRSRSLKTRVVLIGSAAEYGIVQLHENPISEDRQLAPVSAYGISKAWQTQLMGMYVMRGVDVLCARVFNLYGQGISSQLFAGYLENQIMDALAGKRSVIEVGILATVRDYISTVDAAEQLLTIVSRGETGKVYHVASGVPISMRDFAYMRLKAHGLDTSILKEAGYFSNSKGYDAPVIFADTKNTDKLNLGL